MNKHGQTLILFIILIPIILMILAFVVDIGLISVRKTKLQEVTKEVIKEAYNLNDDKIYELFRKNNIEIKNVKVNRDGELLSIEVKEKVKSIFGSIIGINEYKVKVQLVGYMKDGKIVVEKKVK